MQNRQDFTKAMINTLQTGADNLTLADTNEEAANMLALQTRQQLSLDRSVAGFAGRPGSAAAVLSFKKPLKGGTAGREPRRFLLAPPFRPSCLRN